MKKRKTELIQGNERGAWGLRVGKDKKEGWEKISVFCSNYRCLTDIQVSFVLFIYLFINQLVVIFNRLLRYYDVYLEALTNCICGKSEASYYSLCTWQPFSAHIILYCRCKFIKFLYKYWYGCVCSYFFFLV